MTERLFLFMQIEFPWQLGPADGRYVLRREDGADAERVIVVGTVGAKRRAVGPARLLASSRARARTRATPVEPEPQAAEVETTRVTIVDPISLSAERQAQAWLAELDGEHEIRAAFAVLNRVLHFHRIASASPYMHEVSPDQAIVIRAGWGEGEQVADGLWSHAQELAWRGPGGARRKRIGDRAAALRPQERLAVLLGARGEALMCEELALRARLDLDHARLGHAAVELRSAYAAALNELVGENRADLAVRIDELRRLRDGVDAQARTALGDERRSVDEDVVRHALERLEAALRARTAAGF